MQQVWLGVCMHVAFASSMRTKWYNGGVIECTCVIIHLMLSSGGQPVPLIIGPSTSTIGTMLSRILGPFSVPVVSEHVLYRLHQELEVVYKSCLNCCQRSCKCTVTILFLCLSLRSAIWPVAPVSVTDSDILTSSERSPVMFTEPGRWHGWPYASTGLGSEPW